jgi:hypothetical protein
MFQNFDNMQKISKVNVDATMTSFEATAKSVQAIVTEITGYTKRSFENGSKTLEKLFGASSLDKAIEVQSEAAKAAYEDYFAQASKLGRLYADLGKEAFKPYESLISEPLTEPLKK